jgi:DNA-binding transcriptional ArsR family regulator
MSFPATAWALEQPVSVTEKVVLLTLASHADEYGACWPSIKRLVRQTNVSESTVHRALKSLAAKGLIVAEERRGENGRSRSNRYILNMEVHVGVYNNREGVRLTPYISTGVTGDRGEGVTADTREGVTADTPIGTTIKNRHKEPSTNTVDPAIEADFTEFWAAYPKRTPYANPKHSAFESYVKARTVLNVPSETILVAAKAYAQCVAGENPKHTAQAVTWLNQRRWGDEYEPASQAASASDADLDQIVAQYPGPVSDRAEAKRALAGELAKGATLEQIVEAAKKFTYHYKEMRYHGTIINIPILDTWIKFKWRDMDAYILKRDPLNGKYKIRPARRA